MGVVIDFADKALRKKIQNLLGQADAKMDDYNLYRAVHQNAPVGSEERKVGPAIYKEYQDFVDKAVKLAEEVKGPYNFVSKNVAMNRNGKAATDSKGGMSINFAGMVTVTTKGPDYPVK